MKLAGGPGGVVYECKEEEGRTSKAKETTKRRRRRKKRQSWMRLGAPKLLELHTAILDSKKKNERKGRPCVPDTATTKKKTSVKERKKKNIKRIFFFQGNNTRRLAPAIIYTKHEICRCTHFDYYIKNCVICLERVTTTPGERLTTNTTIARYSRFKKKKLNVQFSSRIEIWLKISNGLETNLTKKKLRQPLSSCCSCSCRYYFRFSTTWNYLRIL